VCCYWLSNYQYISIAVRSSTKRPSMNCNKILLLSIIVLGAGKAHAQKTIQLRSPDNNILFTFQLTKNSPVYQVDFKGKRLVDKSTLGLVFSEDGNFAGGLVSGRPVKHTGDETYELVVGKAKTVRSHYEELTVPLIRSTGTGKKQVNLVVRVFNDGVAFRYEF